MQGAQDVVDMMVKNGHPAPRVFKFKDGNEIEKNRIKEFPQLEENLYHAMEGDSFKLSEVPTHNFNLMPIETPGHISDHLCFLLKEDITLDGKTTTVKSFFSGDHIIGSISTWFTDYPKYWESLLKT